MSIIIEQYAIKLDIGSPQVMYICIFFKLFYKR